MTYRKRRTFLARFYELASRTIPRPDPVEIVLPLEPRRMPPAEQVVGPGTEARWQSEDSAL